VNVGQPCQSCSFTPGGGFECVAEQWEARYGKTTHPGRCWNGRCPANAFDAQELDEANAKKTRRDFERRKREQHRITHEQLRIEAA
jgi:N-formylglutamate amidohydrolase